MQVVKSYEITYVEYFDEYYSENVRFQQRLTFRAENELAAISQLLEYYHLQSARVSGIDSVREVTPNLYCSQYNLR